MTEVFCSAILLPKNAESRLLKYALVCEFTIVFFTDRCKK